MRLGITVDMSGADPEIRHGPRAGGRAPRLLRGVDRRGLRHRCRHADHLDSGAHDTDQGGHGDHADPRAHARLRGNDRDVVADPVEQPLPVRAWRLRGAGGGGLARRALRQADDAHQGIHRDHPQDSANARRHWNSTARNTRSPMPARTPPAWAARCAASPTATRHPVLSGLDHPGRSAHRRRMCRRRAADLLFAGAAGRSYRRRSWTA